MTRKEFLGSTSTHERTHLVEHLFLGGDLSLFGQIPGSSESLTTWNDSYLDKWIGILTEP